MLRVWVGGSYPGFKHIQINSRKYNKENLAGLHESKRKGNSELGTGRLMVQNPKPKTLNSKLSALSPKP